MKMRETSRVKVGGVFNVICYDPNGSVKWEDTAENMVVNVGLQHILNIVFSGSTQSATWYVGLADGTPTVASGDTMITHAGWVEITAYDEATRQVWTEVRTNQSLSNTAAKATFTCSTDSTIIGGAFLGSTNNKGGSTGTLMCAAAFTGGDKTASDNDTLEVTYTFTAGDDGA